MEYSEEELRERRNHFGSTLSIFDRKKFEIEFDYKSLKLSEEQEKLYLDNPHIRQVFANEREFIRVNRELCLQDRIVNNETARTPYQRRQGEAKTVEHWGQRKLLMSEIEFLTTYSKPGMTVL